MEVAVAPQEEVEATMQLKRAWTWAVEDLAGGPALASAISGYLEFGLVFKLYSGSIRYLVTNVSAVKCSGLSTLERSSRFQKTSAFSVGSLHKSPVTVIKDYQVDGTSVKGSDITLSTKSCCIHILF